MSIKKKLTQARSDYNYIKSNYGPPHDFSGTGLEETLFNRLLLNPSSKVAFDSYVEMIEEIFLRGYEGHDSNGDHASFLDTESDPELLIIQERYNFI